MSEPRPGTLVETEFDGDIGVIRLNRPESLNAVNTALVEQLVAAFDSARTARAVLLTGRGRAFCAGHDLKAPPEDPATVRARLDRIQDVTRRIRSCPAPVIAVVQGHAVGAGAEFALGCDLVLAGESAQFRFPEVGLGLSATGGLSALLPMLVGPIRAKELVMFGEPLDAATAHRLGLVNAVIPDDELLATAMSWARRLAELPAAPLAMAKEAIDAGTDRAVESALALEIRHAIRTDELSTEESSPASTSAPLNRTTGDRDATRPKETPKREISPERHHHCESRRGGTA
ncbi:Enoyl-CoA hydratase/carnithine racemase [Saccharopolyspora kobensis]|uniref:Enoyl-CoA hydratase/carnithine racemase n=1 Tax=Saccharopolyspora kobensis TaxID=146035 RepID=A0A1H6CVX8_9PSEU|nr:enoyl-CoA hydratase-related protein [Saccharopolyspora kobensis]SEG77142.1 Enoyl-CoA hydratase/carnithine racemase [Saccharopolyspora kobensis]SFD01390.1 Enoyl-CoA hydratase/carnithine racemase [Saccharopolyspora kobensis]